MNAFCVFFHPYRQSFATQLFQNHQMTSNFHAFLHLNVQNLLWSILSSFEHKSIISLNYLTDFFPITSGHIITDSSLSRLETFQNICSFAAFSLYLSLLLQDEHRFSSLPSVLQQCMTFSYALMNFQLFAFLGCHINVIGSV